MEEQVEDSLQILLLARFISQAKPRGAGRELSDVPRLTHMARGAALKSAFNILRHFSYFTKLSESSFLLAKENCAL
jgi:hypothetical protein